MRLSTFCGLRRDQEQELNVDVFVWQNTCSVFKRRRFVAKILRSAEMTTNELCQSGLLKIN
jgi:hypothetical protein